jgi:RimJ/RimL family protein N-acetyltransferase
MPSQAIPSVRQVRLVGEQVELREVTTDDAVDALVWASDDAWFEFLPHEPVRTTEEETAFLERIVADANASPRREYHLGVTIRGSLSIVGMVRLGITSEYHRAGDLGYGLRRDLWGQGIVTEAVRLLIDFGFTQLELHRIWAHHHPDNRASERVLQKLGMSYEGRLRENMLAHGRWRDSNLYAVLEDDWPAS